MACHKLSEDEIIREIRERQITQGNNNFGTNNSIGKHTNNYDGRQKILLSQ